MSTPEGKAAKNLADMGVAGMLNECNADGWKTKRAGTLGSGAKYCIAYLNNDGKPGGWKIAN